MSHYGSIEITDVYGEDYLINLDDYSYIFKSKNHAYLYLSSNKQIKITYDTYNKIREIVCDK